MVAYFNITRITTEHHGLFYQFWATPTLMYISAVYATCLTIISLCLYSNRRNNLIYKVLNLAVLSVFVVALWSYLTDVTFIYVVYILTFVSAVVMLFLSVVLMLPSSAISVPKKSLPLFAVLPELLDTVLLTLCLVLLSVLGSYLVYAWWHTYPWRRDNFSARRTVALQGPADTPEYFRNPNIGCTVAAAVAADFNFHVYSEFPYMLAENLWPHRTYNPGTHGLEGLAGCPRGVPTCVELHPKLPLPGILSKIPGAKFLISVVYELTRYYMFITGTSYDFTWIKGRPWAEKLFHIKPLSHTIPTGGFIYDWRNSTSEVPGWFRLTEHPKDYVLFIIRHPWWSPFSAFHHCYEIPADYGMPTFISVILPNLGWWLEYPRLALRRFLAYSKKIFAYSISRAAPQISSANAEILVQLAGSWSVFLLALPQGRFNPEVQYTPLTAAQGTTAGALENLAAIQHELYIASPLLMLVCVVGLLVALIGAALLVSTKVLNSK